MNYRLNVAVEIVNKVLDGADPKRIPRYATEAMKSEAEIARRSYENDARVEKAQQNWLRKKGLD